MSKRKSDGVGDNFSIRLPVELRDQLQRAADRAGQSLNNEIRNRLTRSFHVDKRIADTFGDPRTYAFFRLLNEVRPFMPNSWRKRRGHWLDDPDQYAQIVAAIRIILTALEPQKRKRRQPKVDEDPILAGLIVAEGLLHRLKDPVGAKDENEKAKKAVRRHLNDDQFDYEDIFDFNAMLGIQHALGDVLNRAPDKLTSAARAEITRRQS